MHNRWEEMLPFYVNHTLNPQDRRALEQHLAQCTACQHALEEWRLVRDVVREEAEGWVTDAPAMPMETRARIAATLPAAPNGRHAGAGYPYPRPQAGSPPSRVRAVRRPRPVRVPVTLMATLAVAAAVVVLLGIWFAGRGSMPPTPTPAQGNVLPVTPQDALAVTLTAAPSSTPPPFASPTPTPLSDLGILNPADVTPRATVTVVPSTTPVPPPSSTWNPTQPWVTAQPWVATPTWVPTPTWAVTPTAQFSQWIGTGANMETTTTVGNIPAGTRVRITYGYYNGSQWLYGIEAADSGQFAEATDAQLRLAASPVVPTPTALFDGALRRGLAFITLTQVGNIPPDTVVHVSSTLYDGTQWLYNVYTDSGLIDTALEWQLMVAPTATPSSMTQQPTGSPTPYLSPTYTPTFTRTPTPVPFATPTVAQ